MKIVIMVEGATERAFKPKLLEFLQQHFGSSGYLKRRPKLVFWPYDHGVPVGDLLAKEVGLHLSGKDPADHVIWLTDVYPPSERWRTSDQAKAAARTWVGEEPRFHPHTAAHDFEAWLLPYWDRIQRHSGSNLKAPAGDPESVNHSTPPSRRINEAYEKGKHKRRYQKTKDPQAILRGADLMVAVRACPELKAFVTTILTLSGVRKQDIAKVLS